MFPNKNFETYYPLPATSISRQPQATTIHNGASVFLETIAQKLGLDSALADTFGDQADKVLHTAIYMCLHGNVMHTKSEPITYQRNIQKIEEQLKLAGMFALMTTDMNLETIQVLHEYSQRDIIEKVFDASKNELAQNRLHTHETDTTTGKMFVQFISLILWSYLTSKRHEISQQPKTRPAETTIQRTLRQLQKIRVLQDTSHTVLQQPLTKKQKTILEQHHINPETYLTNLTKQ